MSEPKFEIIKELTKEEQSDILNHECYVHKMRGNANWWWNHVAEYDHEHVGVTSCKDCGKPNIPFIYKGKIFNRAFPPAYCEDHKK